MPRVKRGMIALKKRRKILKLAKGYRNARRKHMRAARESVIHAMAYAHRDRRVKKRNFRQLWILRINAAARENGLSYSRMINGLKNAGIVINRKILAELAVTDSKVFAQYVNIAKNNIQVPVSA